MIGLRRPGGGSRSIKRSCEREVTGVECWYEYKVCQRLEEAVQYLDAKTGIA